jgi:threonine/homoserine/homoserine lactone efflux protein
VAYLCTGIQLLRTGAHQLEYRARTASLWRLFRDGAPSNLSNPKIAIFYFAYCHSSCCRRPTTPRSVLVPVGLAGLTFVVKAPVGLTAGVLSAWLGRDRARPGCTGRVVPCCWGLHCWHWNAAPGDESDMLADQQRRSA